MFCYKNLAIALHEKAYNYSKKHCHYFISHKTFILTVIFT
ncbi:hypothetical protein M23134_06576 [Microscilla marina ATCC 23134]|uniref:Uncharacterized protein n=1 Tax=Microscilla marina ATCC 23134 TaxID=313606 RepID=A1ZQW1_MICM2|nr:hypothetical protein M23134_06576 [Microscilla marina ATCC 23134]